MKKVIVLLLLAACYQSPAQNVVGYWYGTANVANAGTSNNYLVELIVKQNNASVQAILNYYFRNTFRSYRINGNYDLINRQLSLFNISLPYFGSTEKMEIDCTMDFVATHLAAQAGSSLNGRFIGKEQYKYTCPDIIFNLKLNKEAGNQDSILLALRNFKETYQVWRPTAVDTFSTTIITRPVINYVVSNQFREREKDVVQEITVDADSILVDFYDNGDIDGDSISIFYNNQLLAFNRKLGTRAIHFNMKLDTTREVNEISMFADNLGSIPPNTALMLVYDGKQRHEVRLSSNLSKSGTVRIRRKAK